MIPYSPATVEDIAYVLTHLSEQSKAERDAIGYSNNDLFKRLAPLLRKGRSEVLYLDGHPAYVLGVADGFTWFICTDAAWQHGIAGIRLARKRMARARDIEGKPLICVSHSPHPAAPRWFRALGFEERPMRSVDGARMFVYP